MIQESLDKIGDVDRLGLPLGASLSLLRQMTLDEFGELLLTIPNPSFPHLSEILPTGTPDEVQQIWTGSSGVTLLKQSISFLNFASVNYQHFSGRVLAGARILDFGCGWGRLMRLMAYFADPDRLYGCDAWESSLGHIRNAKVPGSIAKSRVDTDELPFSGVNFDLIYSFSVFTHLPPELIKRYLAAFRKSIASDGLVIITIRPAEFWVYIGEQRGQDYSQLQRDHALHGFAYLPSDEKNTSYGDTSISRNYLESMFPLWKIVRMGVTMIDFQQIFVCLRPV
jgi:hypothetical protein